MLTAIYRQEWRSQNSRLPAGQLDMWLIFSLSLPIHAFGGLEQISTALIKTPVNVKFQELVSMWNNIKKFLLTTLCVRLHRYSTSSPCMFKIEIIVILLRMMLTESVAFLCVCDNSGKGKLKGAICDTKNLPGLEYNFFYSFLFYMKEV
jgi:hypothetical protein